MLDQSILEQNLNEKISYNEFFSALGYTDTDTIFLRRFDDRKRGDHPAQNMSIPLHRFDAILPTLHNYNNDLFGIFYVVNGGGQSDPEVKRVGIARAQFADFDDGTFYDQLRKLSEFPLEPSIIIKTQKSLHPYWLLNDGEIKYFREIQERLAQHFKSDPTMKNESRVMRVYGFNHCKGDPVEVKLIKFDPGLRYTQRQLHEVLPRLEREPKSNGESAKHTRSDGEKVLIGERHNYLISRIGYYVSKIGDQSNDEMIFELLKADFYQNCEIGDVDDENLRSHYFKAIGDCREKFDAVKDDPGFWGYAMKAWRAENPGEQFDTNIVGWDAVREAGLEAKEKGLTFDQPANVNNHAVANAASLSEQQALELSRKQEIRLARTEEGAVLKVYENYCYVLQGDAYLSGKIRYNMLDGRVYCKGFFWDETEHPIRDVDLYNLRYFVSVRYGLSNPANLEGAIYKTADMMQFHPVRDVLNSLQWDGEQRLPELFPRYLGAERSEYTTAVTKLLFYGIIQRVFSPGIKFDTSVILADSRQGTGKSTMCRLLALRDEWYTDSLDQLDDNKRAFEALRGHIVVELGEMVATRRAKDVEAIKAYISRTADDYRIPHGKFAERHPRQCVFIGTTNKPQFLPDDRTGNRRFIPLLLDGTKQEIHPMQNEQETREYVEQCFAEAMVIGASENYPLTLPHEFDDMLNGLQENSTPEDTTVGIIQAWLDCDRPPVVCSRMIWEYALPDKDNSRRMNNIVGTPQKWELQEISDIMNLKIVGYARGKKSQRIPNHPEYGVQRVWIRTAQVVDSLSLRCQQSKELSTFSEVDADQNTPFD